MKEIPLESAKKFQITEFSSYDKSFVDLLTKLKNAEPSWEGGGASTAEPLLHHFFETESHGGTGAHYEQRGQDVVSPRNPQFIFTDITEAFRTSLSLSLGFAFYIQIPLIIYNIWSFFIPSLFQHERKIFLHFCFFFLFLYILATLIIINFIFPFLWNFFLNFETKTDFLDIHCEARISSYISFIFKLCFISHLLFQLPFFSLLFFQFELFNISDIFIHRRLIYWCIILLSAMIAPPDLFIQSSISITFIFILEISFFFLLLVTHYKKVKKEQDTFEL